MVEFINNQNYRGDAYLNYRTEQIKASKVWLDTFFPDKLKFAETHKNVENIVTTIMKNNNEAALKLNKNLN